MDRHDNADHATERLIFSKGQDRSDSTSPTIPPAAEEHSALNAPDVVIANDVSGDDSTIEQRTHGGLTCARKRQKKLYLSQSACDALLQDSVTRNLSESAYVEALILGQASLPAQLRISRLLALASALQYESHQIRELQREICDAVGAVVSCESSSEKPDVLNQLAMVMAAVETYVKSRRSIDDEILYALMTVAQRELVHDDVRLRWSDDH